MDDKRVFLLPGELAFARDRTTISTLLGSCVAVCLHDTKRKWGGMTHYMLPRQTDGNLGAGKYGDRAIMALVGMARAAGSRRPDLVASVYGGGRVAGHLGSLESLGGLDIGARNIEVAIELLGKLSIPVVARDTGGTRGRKIQMDTETNEIACREIITSAESQARADKIEQFRQRRIRVLVVDDSATVRNILRKGIELSDDMEVVGEATDPFVAREKLLETDPDVMCLDIIMPRLDGVSFLEAVMKYRPIPTVIVSTIAKKGTAMWDKALAAGAVDVVDKEELEIYKGLDVLRQILLPKLRNAAKTAVREREATT